MNLKYEKFVAIELTIVGQQVDSIAEEPNCRYVFMKENDLFKNWRLTIAIMSGKLKLACQIFVVKHTIVEYARKCEAK